MRALVEHTSDVTEKRRLQELCSKQGADSYNKYIREAYLGIIDLLTAFPSCLPPVEVIIGMYSSSLLTCLVVLMFDSFPVPFSTTVYLQQFDLCTVYNLLTVCAFLF